MRAADVTPLTAIYHHRSWGGHRAHRAVVLATGNWTPVFPKDLAALAWRDPSTVRYRFQQVEGPITRENRRAHSRIGWLVLTAYPAREGKRIRNADLLAIAKDALAAVQAGEMPRLPESLSLEIVQGREIVQTWEEYRAKRDQQEAAWQAEIELRAAQRDAGLAARDRIIGLIGEAALRPLEQRITAPESWVVLEAAMGAYYQARLNSELAEDAAVDRVDADAF